MALINQISNLKLLKYATAPRGKYSGHNPNPLTREYVPFRFEGIDPNSIDFFYRGGDKTDDIIKRDEKRFSRFLKTINGELFVIKQHTLSRQETPPAAGTIKSEPIREFSINNLEKAISVGGKGKFYDGKGDNSDIPFESKYAYIYKNVETDKNVLVNLYSKKQIIDTSGNNEILSYTSGPGSNFGEGKTIIQFINQRTGINNPLNYSYPTYYNKGGVKLHESDEININTSLTGVSKKEDLASNKTGFTKDGGQSKLFGPKDKNHTPSRDEDLKSQLKNQSNTLGLKMYETSPTNLTSSLGVTNLIQSQVDSGFPLDSNLGTGLSDQGTTTTNFGFNSLQKDSRRDIVKLGVNYLAYRGNSPTEHQTYVGEMTTKESPIIKMYVNLTGDSSLYFPFVINTNHSVYGNDIVSVVSLENNGRMNFYNGEFIPPHLNSDKTFTVFNQELISEFSPFSHGSIYQLEDFRKIIIEKNQKLISGKNNTVLSNSPSYKEFNIETRTKLGDPGRRSLRNVADYTIKDVLDKITASPVELDGKLIEDMIQFSFYAVDTDNPRKNGSTDNKIQFRAFIDSFDDSYSSEWGGQTYIGRGDEFYTYKNTKRSLSLSFTMVAQSYGELKPMYDKLNYFISTLYPDYSYNGIKRGSLLRLTVGGYIIRQLGFLKGIKVGIPEVSPWEIGLQPDGIVKHEEQLPHILKISGLDFQPIPEFLPQKWKDVNSKSNPKWIAPQIK